jgi:hypothetical protein
MSGRCLCGCMGLREALSLPARGGGWVYLRLFWLEAPLLRIPSVRQILITQGTTALHVRVTLSQRAFTGEVVQAVTRVLRRELHLAEAVIERLCVQAVRNSSASWRMPGQSPAIPPIRRHVPTPARH